MTDADVRQRHRQAGRRLRISRRLREVRAVQSYLYVLCAVTGTAMFLIGLYGVLGAPLRPPRYLTVLLEPSGWDERIDRGYYGVLALLGFWLTLGIGVRIVASLALALILGKVLMVGETYHVSVMLPIALAINLSLLLYRMIFRPD